MLKNLKSDLKNLKFGKDQPDGGDSGLPYIKTSIPENATAVERIILESSRFSSDYPQRGGFYAIRAAAEDSIRVRKFLTDFPKGSNFTSKQVGLQKSNPLIETGKNGGRMNTQTYNLNSNLLLSTLTSGTGVHYPRSGATPLTLLDDNNKYFSIVGKKSTEDNRLVNLFNTKILGTTLDSSQLMNLGISNNEFEIMNYPGGPGSLYGDGETTIFKSTDHRGVAINTSKAPISQFSKYQPSPTTSSLGQDPLLSISNFLKNNISGSNINEISGIDGNNNIDPVIDNTFNLLDNVMPYSDIIKEEKYVIGTKIIDFRTKTIDKLIQAKDYTDPMIPMITRIGIGSPGARGKSGRFSVNQEFKEGQDKVNMIPIVHRVYGEAPEKESDGDARDLIKFNFETIDNNNLNYTYRTHFRAFLKGFNDNHSADWNGKRYAGRGENLYTYQGFDRKISFNFTIAPQSKQEMKPLWQKLNYLVSTLCPDYSPGDGFMRGNIHRLTIGEYLYRVPGIITSMNLTIDDNYPWEIKLDQPEDGEDKDMMELPQLINVSVGFTPILDTLARTGATSPIILAREGNIQSSFLKDPYLKTL